MGLNEITEEDIKRIAAYDLVLNRGISYCEMGAVKNILIDSEKIMATVEGSKLNEYKVEVWFANGHMVARCTCPFDGWACKHIVAVLYKFLEEKEKLFKGANLEDEEAQSLRKYLLDLSKERLIEIILRNARKNPEVKTELLEFISEKIEDKEIFISQYHDYWQSAESLLRRMNELGGADIEDENFVINNLNKIVSLIEEGKLGDEIKKEFIENLFYFYNWRNCGLIDFLEEKILEVPSTRADWEFVIEKLKEKNSRLRRSIIMRIYREILEDEEAYLKLRESELEYGADYYELAMFWWDKEKEKKAFEIVREGIKNGEGAVSNLYDFLIDYYNERGDYRKSLKYLKERFDGSSGFLNY